VITPAVTARCWGLGLFAFTVSHRLAGRQPSGRWPLLFTAPPDRWVSGGTAATARRPCATSARPAAGPAFGLIGVAFGFGFMPRSGAGRYCGNRISLPLLVVSVAILNLVLVVNEVLPETLRRRPAGPARKRDLSPLCSFQRVFGNPRVRGLCAAFFLVFPGLRRFTAPSGALISNRPSGWGPGLSRTPFLGLGVGRPPLVRQGRPDRAVGAALRRRAPSPASGLGW